MGFQLGLHRLESKISRPDHQAGHPVDLQFGQRHHGVKDFAVLASEQGVVIQQEGASPEALSMASRSSGDPQVPTSREVRPITSEGDSQECARKLRSGRKRPEARSETAIRSGVARKIAANIACDLRNSRRLATSRKNTPTTVSMRARGQRQDHLTVFSNQSGRPVDDPASRRQCVRGRRNAPFGHNRTVGIGTGQHPAQVPRSTPLRMRAARVPRRRSAVPASGHQSPSDNAVAEVELPAAIERNRACRSRSRQGFVARQRTAIGIADHGSEIDGDGSRLSRLQAGHVAQQIIQRESCRALNATRPAAFAASSKARRFRRQVRYRHEWRRCSGYPDGAQDEPQVSANWDSRRYPRNPGVRQAGRDRNGLCRKTPPAPSRRASRWPSMRSKA